MDEQQALNAPYVLDWNGRVLKFSGLIQDVKAACVSAAKLAAKLEHDENMRVFYPDDLAKRTAEDQEFKSDLVTGRWGWTGDLCRKWRSGTTGVVTFVAALLDSGGTPLTRDEILQLIEDKSQEVLAILALVDWDISNPKQKRPARLAEMEAIAAKLR